MNILHTAKRIILQTVNDKRSLALILFVPLLIFTLIFFLLGKSDYKPTVAQSGLPSEMVDKLKEQDLTLLTTTKEDGLHKIKDFKADALVYKQDNEIRVVFETNDTVKTSKVMEAIQKALKALPSGTATIKTQFAALMQKDPSLSRSPSLLGFSKMLQGLPSDNSSVNSEFLYGKSDASLFDSLGYVMLGIVSFFIVFIIAGISFVRERTTQTMERLMMTPIRRWQVMLGYTLGFSFFAILQSILSLAFVRYVLHLSIAGSIFSTGLIMILLSMAAVCIGAFFSIFSNNEFQIMQFIPVVVIPQIFFSGLISLDTMPYHLGAVAKIMPVYYACDALKSITIRGFDLGQVLPDILALIVFILLFSLLNTLALKKYRRI